MIAYIAAHWRGELSLARSFWVNLVALRLVVFGLQGHLESSVGEDRSEHAPLVLALALFAHGILFVWQIVGTLRAAERDLVATGTQAPAWGAQLGGVVLCFLTFAHAVEAWQTTRPLPDEERADQRFERERRERYSLLAGRDGTRLLLRGSIELGVTRRVEALLSENGAITGIVLESDGGNVYAARGLARVMRERALSSHVERTCASACTIAFIGGRPRSMTDTARLGFHQYRLEDERGGIGTDPGKEQARDQALYAVAGVDPGFVSRLFEQAPDGMWWPSADELVAAGVVDTVSVTRRPDRRPAVGH